MRASLYYMLRSQQIFQLFLNGRKTREPSLYAGTLKTIPDI